MAAISDQDQEVDQMKGIKEIIETVNTEPEEKMKKSQIRIRNKPTKIRNI